MGCDAPRPLIPVVVCVGDCARCLNRGLRGFSQMGCDAPRPFVPIVVCVGDCARRLNRGLRVLSEPRITRIAQMGYDFWGLVNGSLR